MTADAPTFTPAQRAEAHAQSLAAELGAAVETCALDAGLISADGGGRHRFVQAVLFEDAQEAVLYAYAQGLFLDVPAVPVKIVHPASGTVLVVPCSDAAATAAVFNYVGYHLAPRKPVLVDASTGAGRRRETVRVVVEVEVESGDENAYETHRCNLFAAMDVARAARMIRTGRLKLLPTVVIERIDYQPLTIPRARRSRT